MTRPSNGETQKLNLVSVENWRGCWRMGENGGRDGVCFDLLVT